MLITQQYADRSNIIFNGDEIALLGDTLTLGIVEAMEDSGFINTGMNKRFQKIKLETER